MVWEYLIAAALVIVSGCTIVDVSIPDPDNGNGFHDFSDFARFEFEHAGGFGFCPPIGGIYRAAITRSENNEYELTMSLLVEDVDGGDDCIDEITMEGCYVESSFDPRELFLSEIDAVEALFSMVETTDPFEMCATTSFDLCDVNSYTWDDSFTATDHPCAGHRLSETPYESLLTELRRRSEALIGTVEDFSGFTEFAFAQLAGLGFCPTVGDVLSAELIADGNGSYVFTAQVLDAIDAEAESCPEDHQALGGCMVVRDLSARTLTDEESAIVLATFSTVALSGEPEPFCEGIAFDPCVIQTVTWDGVSFTDNECTAARADVEPIVTLLSNLAAADME